MAAHALIDALPDFGARPVLRAAPPPPAPPPVDIEALVAHRVAEAEAALAERFQEALDAERAETEARHAAGMAAERARLGEAAAALIGERLADMEHRLATLGGDALARMLGSLMSEELQRRALARLAGVIRAALADRDAVRVEIGGPVSLIEPLRDALGDQPVAVDYVERPGFDVVVAIDGDLFETRLGEWSATLSDIIA